MERASPRIPTAYTDGYRKARPHDPVAVDNYLRHTGIGDPELAPIMEEFSDMPPAELHRCIGAGIEGHDHVLRAAPEPLRDFFKNVEEPSWLDYDALRPGIRAFHRNVGLMLVAFVTGVLVEGFSTLIAKSFNITGRVGSTTRRLQQNNRHMMDIFFPGGMQRNGDGWKLSARIRFVHTRIRTLLDKSDDWDHEAWDTPLSAAHLGFAISVFSKRLLEYSMLVGAQFTEEAYRLSRALIGDRLATAFDFPKKSPWDVGTLFQYRTKQRVLRRLAGTQRVRAHNFTQLLQISVYDDEGLSYRMPDHVHTAKSRRW